ncbi:hypothetical protein UMZ34_19695 [Halopseudomonas pachastrellae]|nr:hypothetical protein UMZ34_19695 [Halopseudomonas pachastrellae]
MRGDLRQRPGAAYAEAGQLAAGESTTISQSFLRAITRVRVTLNCHAS